MSFSSIHFNVIQTTKRYTALARFAYQTCSIAVDRFGRVDYRADAAFRVGGCVLLPAGAPAEFADWETFHAMAAFRETHRKAQDGRILDFALPRAVPRELLVPLASFTLLPFLELGMAVRLDVECVVASDGKPNAHAHVWLAQRLLSDRGFDLKERSWNTFFRRNGGMHVRALVASQLTLGCAILGIEAFVDPRCNDAKGAGNPEPRLPRRAFHIYKSGRHVEEIEQLKVSRRLKRDHDMPKLAPEPLAACITVTNAVEYSLNAKTTTALRERFTGAALEAGYDVESEPNGPSSLAVVSLIGTSITFDGRAFRIEATGGSEDAAIVARFARELDWPALVVEGGSRLADLMAIATADEGVFMINRAPSAAARDIISRAFFPELRAAIARHDPVGVATEFPADLEANTACAQVDVPEAPMHVDAAREDNLQSAADLVSAKIVPAEPNAFAETAFALPPSVTTSSNDARAVSAGSEVKQQTVGASSEGLDDMESLPDDNSWKIGPDPGVLAQNARHFKPNDERRRRMFEDVDEILRRMCDRSSGLRSEITQLPLVGQSGDE